MPYYHKNCNGTIPMRWPIKCKACNKKWSWKVMFASKPPSDMYFALKPHGPIRVKGTTSYAKWGDNIPGVSVVASRMPNWPKWARVLLGSAIVVGLVYLLIFLVSLFRG